MIKQVVSRYGLQAQAEDKPHYEYGHYQNQKAPRQKESGQEPSDD